MRPRNACANGDARTDAVAHYNPVAHQQPDAQANEQVIAPADGLKLPDTFAVARADGASNAAADFET